MSTLADLTKPYAGEYVLEKLVFGGVDYSQAYDVTLRLGYDGKFSLIYGERQWQGDYQIDSQTGEITFSTDKGKFARRTFPIKDGAVLIDLLFGGRLLHAEFKMP